MNILVQYIFHKAALNVASIQVIIVVLMIILIHNYVIHQFIDTIGVILKLLHRNK